MNLGNPEAKAILDGWGLTMEDAGIELPGRRIAPPNIIVNQNCILKSQINFGSEISKNPCLQPVSSPFRSLYSLMLTLWIHRMRFSVCYLDSSDGVGNFL